MKNFLNGSNEEVSSGPSQELGRVLGRVAGDERGGPYIVAGPAEESDGGARAHDIGQSFFRVTVTVLLAAAHPMIGTGNGRVYVLWVKSCGMGACHWAKRLRERCVGWRLRLPGKRSCCQTKGSSPGGEIVGDLRDLKHGGVGCERAGNSHFTTPKSTLRISLSFFGTEQLPP